MCVKTSAEAEGTFDGIVFLAHGNPFSEHDHPTLASTFPRAEFGAQQPGFHDHRTHRPPRKRATKLP